MEAHVYLILVSIATIFLELQPRWTHRKSPGVLFVIPAKAGILSFKVLLGSRFRGSEGFWDFLRDHQPL
jgi:hypothetical protein